MRMKQFKLFSTCCSFIILALTGCTGFSKRPHSISKIENVNVMSYYCQSGKQIRPVTMKVVYYSPRLESGIPIDQAAEKMKELESDKITFLRELFYSLSHKNGESEDYFHYTDGSTQPKWFILTSDSENDVLENIKSDESSTKSPLYKFIVLLDDKAIIYHTNLYFRKMNYASSYLSELSLLVNDYTILMPKNVYEKATRKKFNYNYIDINSSALNETGGLDITKALENQNDIWRSYIWAFTTVKEVAKDDSNKSIAELSLDLNVFCKYGRKIRDLQTQ